MTSHMTKNQENLNNKRQCERSDITVANSSKLKIDCAGDVSMKVNSGKIENNAKLIDVKYVPGLCANLVSVSRLAKMGNRIVFEGDTCKIFNANRELIATAILENDLYRLQCQVKQVQNEEKAMIACVDFNVWHRRMGHICDDNLIKVKNSTIGVNFVPDKTGFCKSYLEGKQSRASFPKLCTDN